MKSHKFLLLMFLIHSSSLFSDANQDYAFRESSVPVQHVFMQANNINTVFSTDGIFNLDRITFTGPDAGLIWPVTSMSRKTADYASGIWIGAKVGPQRELRLAACSYNSHYSPGNIPVVGQIPPSSVCNDPAWRGYLVNLVDPGLVNGGTITKYAGGRQYTFTYDSWANWPISRGAPYVEVNNIPGYQPGYNADRPGIWHTTARPDEISFMVYMDFTNCTNNIHISELLLPGGTFPLGVEIQQISFAFGSPGYTNMYFMKWRIINKSLLTWDSTFISIFDDADMGDPFDDAAGCDSIKNIGLLYNHDNNDAQYGAAPPAIGYRILQSPMRYTGNPSDTAILPYGNFTGYRLTGMTGYYVIRNGGVCEGDPSNAPTAFNFMRGKDGCGNNLINWVMYKPTNYKYHIWNCNNTEGWRDSTGGDRRQILNMGPITMNSQSEQFVLAACVIGRSSDNLQSRCDVITKSDAAYEFYWQSFGGTPIGIQPISSEVPNKFALYQNYPNPFNPATKLRFDIAVGTRRGAFVQMIIYDILGQEIATLVNEELQPGTYEVEWNAENYPSGVYFYTLTSEKFSESKKMILMK